jgi:iron complex transport system permease protein
VGLVSPHAARILVGPVHRRLLPAAAIIGALLTVLADLFSRCIAPPLEIPVGIITSLGGAPFFLYLLAKKSPR